MVQGRVLALVEVAKLRVFPREIDFSRRRQEHQLREQPPAFRMKCAITTPTTNDSVWLLMFYDRILFWADTIRRDAKGYVPEGQF